MDRLIELLKSNARAPIEEIAKSLDLPEEEVLARIAAMEADGTLVGYQAIFNPEKIGDNCEVEALIEVCITPERGGGFDRLASRIARFKEVESCYLMSGGYDLLVVVKGPNLQSVARFISEKLSTIKGVLSTATRFRLKTYKERGLLLIRDPAPQRLPVSP